MRIVQPNAVLDTDVFRRASTATYYDATGIIRTAGVDVLRSTYDPSNLTTTQTSLIESAATNHVPNSTTMSNSSYFFAINVTPTDNVITSPDGTMNCGKFLETTNSGPHQVLPLADNSLTNLCASVYAKPLGRDWIYLNLQGFGGTNHYTYFNITTGVIGSSASGTTATIQNVGNGFYRCAASRNDGDTYAVSIGTATADGTPSFVGDVTKGAYLWGFQSEQGNSPTSYIPTTTGTVVRAQDNLNSYFNCNVLENDYPAYSASKIYKTGDNVIVVRANVHEIYQSLTGSTSTVTMTVATPCVVTWTAHGLVAGTPISFTTTGALPTNIVANTVYYVSSPSTNTFNISATVGGSAINTTGSQSGVHTAVASTNYNIDPVVNAGATNAVWLDLGATNRWSMFDQSVQSQTTYAGNIIAKITYPGYVDTVVLLNVAATNVTVAMTSDTDGIVYNQTTSLVDNTGVTDWYTYFFTPTKKKTDIVFTGMPRYANAEVAVTLDGQGGATACGALIPGLIKDISSAQAGVEQGGKLSIIDYSIKSTDDFGNITIVQRAFNRRANWTVYIDGNQVDSVYNLLSSYRATPVVYIGGKDYGSTILYGFYKSFDIDVSYIDMPAIVTIEIESLT